MLSRAPFVGFVVSLILGILSMEYWVEYHLFTSLFLYATLFLSIVATILSISLSKRLISGVLIVLIFFQLGLYVKNQTLHTLKEISTDTPLANAEFYTASVNSLPFKRENSIRLELVINKVFANQQWYATNAKILASFPVNAEFLPDINDQIIVKGAPKRPSKALNPLAFDYAKFLENKGIYFTDFLRENRYTIIPQSGNSGFLKLQALKVSKWADNVFRTQIRNDRSYGLIKAMLLGRRDDLRADQIQDFTMSGVVHILSVSGLHVGILVLILLFSFGWLKRLPYGKYIFLVVILSLLTFYALVTGLPSSVIRASIMFGVLLIGKTFERKIYGVNTLAISALIILVVDPNSIFDIGFQLSYMAMLGIILFFPIISRLFKPKSKIVQFVWDVTVLSLVAQLGTFPITVYYFHQFPVYFLLINPFVIFLANFLIIGPIAMLFFTLISFDIMVEIARFWIELSAYCVNNIAAIPKVLPYNLLVGLYLDKLEVVFLFLVIFVIWYLLHSATLNALKWLFFAISIFGFYSIGNSTFNYYNNENRVMSIPQHSVMTFKKGQNLYIVADSLFQLDNSNYKYHIENYALSMGICSVIFTNGVNNIINHRNTKFGALYSSQGKYYYVGSIFPISNELDYILLSGYTRVPFIRERSHIQVMLGGQIFGKRREAIITSIKQNNWRYYELNNGSLVL